MLSFKKLFHKKKKIKPEYIFYPAFFVIYLLAIYFLIYQRLDLSPLQYNIYFFSNVMGSFFRRAITELIPYVFLFYVAFYTKKEWIRGLCITLFSVIFSWNIFIMGYTFFTRLPLEIFALKEPYFWFLFSRLVPIVLILVAVVDFFLIKIKDRNKGSHFYFKTKSALFFFLTIIAFTSPIKYNDHITLFQNDTWVKKYHQNESMEKSGIAFVVDEAVSQAFSAPPLKKLLTKKDKEWIESKNLDTQIALNLQNPPKKIILIVAQSLNQNFLSHYNNQLSSQTTPVLDGLIKEYPHIDDFYPSSLSSIGGFSSLLCGHTNKEYATKNSNQACIPVLLAEKDFQTEVIGDLSAKQKPLWDKFGFNTFTSLAEEKTKFPFEKALNRLKNSPADEKFFLTLVLPDLSTPIKECEGKHVLSKVNCEDERLGQFMDQLKQEELLTDDVAVLITSSRLYPRYSDVKGDDFNRSFRMKPDKLPFILILNQINELQARLGSQIDIASTLLALAGVDVPPYYLGKNLISDPNTFAVGQSGKNGYMILNDEFNYFDFSEDIDNLTPADQPKVMKFEETDFENINDLEAVYKIIQARKKALRKKTSENITLLKWYYNNHFIHEN